MKNNKMSQKDLILRLIRDDLVHYRLVTGLNDLGLHAHDYHLHLADTIFDLMGFEAGRLRDLVFENAYMVMAARIKDMDLSLGPREKMQTLDELSGRIYTRLEAMQRDWDRMKRKDDL